MMMRVRCSPTSSIAFILSAVTVGAVAAPARAQWLKGQTHVHSNNSGDSKTPPADVVRWYAARGYDFIVFTDHNRITVADGGKLLALPGVELTQNLATCAPPPVDGAGCLLHVNALAVAPPAGELAWPPLASPRRLDVFGRALDLAARLGGVAQLNHPNFHYSLDAALITALARRGPLLLEIANEAIDSNNAGDAAHPSTEALWDAALTAGATVWGVASDDAHHYFDADAVRSRGEDAFTGDRGFVMVRAARTADAIRDALRRGDFYASNGLLLAKVAVEDGALVVAAQGERAVHFAFIGAGGRVLAASDGRAARFPLARARGGYVRALVTASDGKKAWTQPVRVP